MLSELNPLTNARSYLIVLGVLALFGLVGALDGPDQQARYRRAAEQIQAEYGDCPARNGCAPRPEPSAVKNPAREGRP